MTKMSLVVTCNHCQGAINASVIKLEEKNIIICEDNKGLVITYFKCPHCGYEYNVMADDAETKELFSKYEELARKLRKQLEISGKEHDKQKMKFSAIGNKLKVKRDALREHYNKSFYQNGDLKEQLEFSLPAAKKTGLEKEC